MGGGEDRHFHPLPTAGGDDAFAVPFRSACHGWLRMLGDFGSAGSWPTTWGLRENGAAIAMLLSEREKRVGSIGPTLVVCPMQRRAAVGGGDREVRARLRGAFASRE